MRSDRAGASLRVLTQNIFGGGPRWDMRRALLARRIARVRPDIVGLQEVHADDVGGTASQAHELAALLGGYHVDFAPARIMADGSCEGVALLCRSGIRERSVEALTLDRGDFLDRNSPRVVLCAMLDAPAGPVDVFVTHLSLSRRARARTMGELTAFAARERRRSRSLGAVLMGDFNALPGDEVIAALERCGPTEGGPWRDVWRHCGAGRARGGATWPAIAPFRRIDYVFVQSAESFAVDRCEVEPVSGSDHRGLAADLTLDLTRARCIPNSSDARLDPRSVPHETGADPLLTRTDG